MAHELTDSAQIFRALGDPVRLSILRQIADTRELACSALKETLPVSTPTISYHTKILRQAGIIDIRKRGRRFFYSIRRDALGEVTRELRALGRCAGHPFTDPKRQRH